MLIACDYLELKAENTPDFLKRNPRWAPFKLVWNEKRGKYDKVPVNADNMRIGLSTAAPKKWFSFDAALAAYERHRGVVHGIGYCMTGVHGIVGVDLDRASDENGKPEPWAAEILREALRLGFYCERSVSGLGFRIFYEGETPEDWANHQRGIEVYGGHAARFLTVTGHRITEAIE